jgi:RecB family endonuclease NucS
MDEIGSQVFALLGEGLTTHEVAERLGVSWQTVAGYKGAYPAGAVATDAAGAIAEAESAQNLKFGLERDMQNALRTNIDQLDASLRIVDEGKERQVAAGFIDILAEDDKGSLVVIELKAAEAPDAAVTQLLSYIGSLKGETPGSVRGILIARGFSPRIRLAASAADIQLVEYGFDFTFTSVSTNSRA